MKKLIALALLLACGWAQAANNAQGTQFTKTLVLGDSLSSGGAADWVAYAPAWYYDAARNESVASTCMGDYYEPASLKVPNTGIARNADAWLTTHSMADSVILFAGVNDISSYRRSDGAKLFADFQAAITAIKRHPNVTAIVVLPPIPFGSPPGKFGYQRAQEYMAMVEAESANDPLLHYFDAWTYMEDPNNPGYQKAGYTDGVDHTHTIAAGAIALEAGITAFIKDVVVGGSVALPVRIDVDPWSSANKVLPESDNLITVTVMGGATDFDATQVDPASLKLGLGEGKNVMAPWVDDFNGDTEIDVAFGFRTQDAGIFCGDIEITLVGATYGGDPFIGTDTISTSDCKYETCHP